jgi:SAM-dependent methyltransferase
MNDLHLHRSILKEFGRELTEDSLILDFGCGDGVMVNQYRRSGLQAFGVDVRLDRDSDLLRLIQTTPTYRIPFDKEWFDFVFSNSVLEHVKDLDSALSEIYRVLKPGGASLHIFPARAKPIEPHVFVPFAGMLQNRAWLTLWAFLGIRNSFQKNMSFAKVARWNHDYLHRHTFYRSRHELRTRIRRQYGNVTFADKQIIRHSYGNARHLRPVVELFPTLATLYGLFHNRCVYFEKPTRPQ